MTKQFIQKYHIVILIVVATLLLAFGVMHVFGFVSHHYLKEEPLHSSIEAIGAIMFILIAVLIFVRFHEDESELDYPLIAMGFLGMGIFDLYHSFQQPGNNFVLSHILSLLNGGFWFALLLLSTKIKEKIKKQRFPYFSVSLWFVLVLLLSLGSDLLPMLNDKGSFTNLSYILNSIAGAGFLAGTIFLLIRYRKNHEIEIFIIAVISLIQALSSITFHSSEVWDLEWWLWHFYRFGGSIILFYSVFFMFRKMSIDLEKINRNQQVILNTMPFGLMIVGNDKKVIQINKAAQELTGFSEKDTIDRFCFESVCKSDCDRCPVIDLKEEIDGKEVIVGKKDGSSFPALKTVKSIVLNDEEVLLEGFVDMSEVVKAEEELRLNEQKFKEIFDSVTNSIFIIDFNHGIIEVNKTAIEQYGYSKEEFLKMTPLDFIHPDYKDVFQWFIKDVKTKGKFKGQTIDLRKDGTGFYTDVSGTIVTFNGKPHLLASVRDISDIKEAEQGLKNTLMDLERSNKELEQFAYVSSHDLQEPLRKIKNYSDLIVVRNREKLDDKGKKYLDIISRGATRMQKMIDDLLGISRITTRGEELKKIDLKKLIIKVDHSLKNEVLGQEVDITAHSLPKIIGDEKQFYTLFYQLISNAIKFKGKTDPKIEISAEDKGIEWLISIKDNGIGLDMKYADKIFIIFQRLHSRSEYEGTGIGLAMCKKIVEKFGGKIWVESEPGNGAIFYFTVPRLPE